MRNKFSFAKKKLEAQYKRRGDMRFDFRNQALYDLVGSRVKGQQVLDIGCGSGLFLKKLSEMGKRTWGIEANEKLVEFAEELHPGIKIIHGFANDIDNLVNNTFDTITMIDVLEHVSDDVSVLRKVSSQINKGGRLILVVPAYNFLYGVRDEQQGHFRRYSKKELKNKLKVACFKVTELRYWNMLGFLPYFIYEKTLSKPLYVKSRSATKKGMIQKSFNQMLFLWLNEVENRFNIGFGLSLFCVAEK